MELTFPSRPNTIQLGPITAHFPLVANPGYGVTVSGPTTTAFTPSGGKIGSQVTLRGHHFIGAAGLTFNGVKATFTVLNVKFITATLSSRRYPRPQDAVSDGCALPFPDQSFDLVFPNAVIEHISWPK